MKKDTVSVLVLLLLSGLLSAQSDVTQITLPKKIFIGDTVELQYTFRSAVDFFSDTADSVTTREINIKSLGIKDETDDYTVTKALLERRGLSYTFSMTFIPWRTGDIDFPPVNLAGAVYGASSPAFSIDVKPVSVSSILRESGDTSLRPPAGPQLLPGTVYALYAAIIIIIIFIAVLVRLIVKWPVICKVRKEKKILRSYARNAKELFRRLKHLEKAGRTITDRQFCAELQRLLRRYLDFRYGYHFSTVLTSQFMAAFENVTAGMLSDKKRRAAEEITAVMFRTDYIRYAHDSIDSMRQPADQYEARLGGTERVQLLAVIRSAVDSIEEVQ